MRIVQSEQFPGKRVTGSDHRLYVSAFSLVEVTLALGIAGFCLLAIFGLLPVGLRSNNTSIEQTAAANISRAIMSDLRVTQANPPATTPSKQFQIPIPTVALGSSTAVIFFREDGSVAQSTSPTTVNIDADLTQSPRYRALIAFSPPATGRAATALRIFITWPAVADKTASPAVPTKYSGSYEVVTALDRN